MTPEKPFILEEPPLPLPDIFQAIHRSKFTGKIVMHFKSGYPSVIDVPGHPPRRWIVSPA